MFEHLSKRYHTILLTEAGLFNRARISILLQLLTAFAVLSVFLFILYFFQERNILLYRISLLMVLFFAGLMMLFLNVSWRIVGHYFMFCLTCFIWSNLLILKNGFNIVTVQYVLMIVSGGYYILGLRWGWVYSLINTVPIVVLFSLEQFYGISITLGMVGVNIYAYNISIIFNFLLLIFIHFYFFRAFKRTSKKERKLTANLERSLRSARIVAEEKTNFLSTMAHELRTPLNAVIGITNVLMENDPKPQQKEDLEILHFSAENLMATIDDILSFNRLDLGIEKLELTTFGLDTLLNNVYGALKLKSDAKSIDFFLQVDKEIVGLSVQGDQNRLTQILFNIVGNAIKFTQEGFVKIIVCVEKSVDNVLTVGFEISDSGIGIAGDQVNDLFDPYFRGENGTNRQYYGTGLGLSIASRLVELHGGRLTFKSKEGTGTTFSFQLNFTKVDPMVDELKEEVQIPADEIARLQILVVDDSPVNVMVFQKTLSRWNLKADVAENGQIGLDAVMKKTYDVIFMDINMPVMDGLEASRMIREINDKQKKGIYIIALTASIDISFDKRSEFGCMDDFMLKPFYPKDLEDKLHHVAKLKANRML
ncbi:response regulator [Pedobacter hiemivivus]|uniref:histidine kinase n=1 Tax=Pedobacter hiemivivus TaxID=2530454 RepID=A0A4U1G7E8_9SPHI|nr:ATP-binding protein [Pedobacter hiemivivus]TKC58493.1 response regulator [Pedobacter hiemivivus]